MYILCKDNTNIYMYFLQNSSLQDCGHFNRIQVSGKFETHPDLTLILHNNFIMKMDSLFVQNALNHISTSEL